MDVFNHYLPWNQQRINRVALSTWERLFSPSQNIPQDQAIPISNLMALLFEKLHGKSDFSIFKKRADLVNWYQNFGRSIFNIDELEFQLNHPSSVSTSLRKGGVNLVGYSRGRLGLGEDIRSFAVWLDHLKIPYSIVRIGHPTDDPINFTSLNEGYAVFDKTIVFMNPIEIEKLVGLYDDFSGVFGRVIAVPPWELETTPPNWKESLQYFEEVWGISQFTSRALEAVHGNVVYSPPLVLPASNSSLKPRRSGSPFRFLYIFDAGSFIERKNPIAVVKAFQKAFSRNENVELILKVANIRDSLQWQEVLLKVSADKRIRIRSELMTSEQLETLLGTANCYVSLHRSEGFGRTIAEAIARQIPVVATKYSGSLDMFEKDYPWLVDVEMVTVKESEYPCSNGAQWADANIEDAAIKMRQLYLDGDGAETKVITKRALMFLEQRFMLSNEQRPLLRWLKCEKE